MSLTELEKKIDRLNRLMGVAYDRGDMREWKRLRKELEQVGRQYRRLADAQS